MGLEVGDLFDDGSRHVFIGTSQPGRPDLDILYCNGGAGLVRCTDSLTSAASSPFRTRAHGTVFGDVNHDARTGGW